MRKLTLILFIVISTLAVAPSRIGAGNEAYFNRGTHNNLRITFGHPSSDFRGW